MHIHAKELSLDKQYPFMVSVIKSYQLLTFKILMVSVKDDVGTITMRCTFLIWR